MHTVRAIVSFYREGFQAMVLGRTLWKIVVIKLVILMVVIKMFLCPDYLKNHFATDRERSDHVLAALSQPAPPPAEGHGQ